MRRGRAKSVETWKRGNVEAWKRGKDWIPGQARDDIGCGNVETWKRENVKAWKRLDPGSSPG